MCLHENFQAKVDVQRLLKRETDDAPYAFVAEISIQCAVCLVPFKFLGTGVGMSPLEPLTDLSGQTLNAPIVPVGQEDMIGSLGYRITTRGSATPVIE